MIFGSVARAVSVLRLSVLRHQTGIVIGRKPRIALSSLLECPGGGEIVIGDDVQLCRGAIVSTYGGTIQIGDRVFIGPYCVLYGHGGLTVGPDTLIAAHTVIVPANHRYRRRETPIREQGLNAEGVVVGRDCWLGCGVRILDGVTIGDGCIVAAGAVVSKSVPANTVVAGVPATVISER